MQREAAPIRGQIQPDENKSDPRRKDTGGRGLWGNKHQLIKIKTVGSGCFSSVNCLSWSRAMWRGTANLWCDGFRGVLQQTDSVWLFDKKKIWNVTSFKTLLCRQIRLVLNGCFTMRGCSSKLHTNTVFYPLNAPSHTGWQQECIAGNERPTVRTPLSLSFSLLTVQHCSASLHMPRQTGREPQQVWAHEKYYQPASQTLCTKAVFAHGTESLVLQKCKWTPSRRFWNLKNAPMRTHRLLQESNLWRSLDRAFFCLKVTLPPTNCCVQNEHSWCSFNVQYYTTSL